MELLAGHMQRKLTAFAAATYLGSASDVSIECKQSFLKAT
jgi:hypothetical protein